MSESKINAMEMKLQKRQNQLLELQNGGFIGNVKKRIIHLKKRINSNEQWLRQNNVQV